MYYLLILILFQHLGNIFPFNLVKLDVDWLAEGLE